MPNSNDLRKQLLEACRSAVALLRKRSFKSKKLLALTEQIAHDAKTLSSALEPRDHDYWQEVADAALPLSTTLRSYINGEFDNEPMNILRKQVDDFISASEDAADSKQ